LIFIPLSLDLNRVRYLGIFLVSDSFRSPPSTRIDPSYLTKIKLYLLVESVSYKLDVPVYKRSLTRSKEVPLRCMFLSCPAPLPESLPGRVTPYPISYPNAYPGSYPRLCPIPYLSRYPVPHPSRTRSFSRVLPGHVPDRVNPALPERLLSRVKSYPIMYPALPEAYPVE
jgi:hypothetical protein